MKRQRGRGIKCGIVFNLVIVFLVNLTFQNPVLCQDSLHYVQSGKAKLEIGKWRPSIKDFSKAIQHSPELAEAFYLRGYAKFQLKYYDEAISDFDEAIRLDAEYAEAYYYRGKARFKNFDIIRALSDYRKVISLHPKNAGWMLKDVAEVLL